MASSMILHSNSRVRNLALQNALRPIEKSDQQFLLEWEKRQIPADGTETPFYEMYPYSLPSYYPASEAGPLYREWLKAMTKKQEIQSPTPWTLSMIDSDSDGKVTRHDAMNKSQLIELLDETPSFRLINIGRDVRQFYNAPIPPVWVLQLVFTRYEVSPKFLDIYLDAGICAGSLVGVWMRSSYQPHTAEPQSLNFHFELACPLLADDAKGSWVLKSVNKTFDFIRLSVCLRHLFFDNSSVVLIGPATPSLLMRRFQECLGQKQLGTNALFLAPLVLLSYVVQEWRKVLSWSLDEAMILESYLKDPNKPSPDFGDLPAYIQDCSFFVGQLAAITKDFEVFSQSFHVEFPAEHSETSDHRVDAVKYPSHQFLIQQEFRNLRREVSDLEGQVHRIETTLKRSFDALYNGREVENTENIKRLLEESNTHGKIMTTIANASRKDGERMKMIAVISMLYAPGAYFSGLIGTDIIEMNGQELGVGRKFWIYLTLTVVSMFVITALVEWPILRDSLATRKERKAARAMVGA